MNEEEVTRYNPERLEARYQQVKGVLERNHSGNVDKFNDDELVQLLRLPPELLGRIRYELSSKKESNEEEDLMELKHNFLSLVKNDKTSHATEIMVNHILKHNYIYTTKEDKNSEIWIYRGGIYLPNGRSEVKIIIRNILEEWFNAYYCNQILNKIEADTFIETEKFFKSNSIHEIPVENGVLNIVTRELTQFNPKKIFFTKLPVTYKPKLECNKIDKFLSDVLKDEDDKNVFYELGGFSLMKEYTFEKSFMFLGGGRNGKGKCLQLLKKVVGHENCCSIPLSSLQSDSFQISELFGKMLNLAGDIGRTDLKDTSMFKALTGRDNVTAKRKFLRDISFENFAKMVFACNDLPMVYDMSKGFWDRWILLEFPYTFEDLQNYDKFKDDSNVKLRDEDIIFKITTEHELSGLLNKFLDGFDRLTKNKGFSSTRGTEETKNLWIRKSNSFIAFCMDNVEEDYDSKIRKKDLRKLYSSYCKEHKVPGKSDAVIKITLQEMYGVIDERIQVLENSDWYWTGIKLKEGNERNNRLQG